MDAILGSINREGQLDRVKQLVREFEEQRQLGKGADLREFWRGGRCTEAEDIAALAALVKSDLRERFGRGETPDVAQYLTRFPELHDHNDRILSLIYEEFCLREERGESLDVESFCNRYPDWKDSLASQLQYHRLISQAAGIGSITPKFPREGDFFGEFELLSMLGTGGSSRVFLARDTSLGNRVVVLKVAVDRGNEPMILGRLVHPRIVWVNSVSYQPETQLRGLSMPYYPGLPLDEMIKGFPPNVLPREASIFWDLLQGASGHGILDHEGSAKVGSVRKQIGPEAESGGLARDLLGGDGWKDFPIRGTYAQGVAWIGRVLADALQHAHARDTFHRDIKPGNVLMTLSHGPQLLDFNLAESPHSAERADDALHGGTLPYMAPEQIRAFLDPSLWRRVGASADIYSLGLVLRELLTGRLPDLPDEKLPRSRALGDFLDRRACLDPSIRRLNPSVPYALEAIVARCLAYEPKDRYADASALAIDLDCFLKSRPLMTARNPSYRERANNWLTRCRRPVELAIAGSIAAATWLQPLPVERVPAFGAAIHAYGRNHSDEAIVPLKNLATAYPDSPLPQLFLALARNKSILDLRPAQNSSDLDRRPSEESFRKAMAVPNAVPQIVEWARKHSEIKLVQRLDEFAENCLDVVNKFDPASPATFGGRGPDAATSLTELARTAFQLALLIEPGESKSSHGMALIESSRGNHQLADELISACFGGPGGHDPHEDLGRQFSLFLARSQIACSWAEHLLTRRDAVTIRQARSLLDRALTDLDTGDRFRGQGMDAQSASLKARIQAILLLIETDVEQRQFDEARRHIAKAEGALTDLSLLGPDPSKVQEFRRQLDQSMDRIKAAAGTASGDSSLGY